LERSSGRESLIVPTAPIAPEGNKKGAEGREEKPKKRVTITRNSVRGEKKDSIESG